MCFSVNVLFHCVGWVAFSGFLAASSEFLHELLLLEMKTEAINAAFVLEGSGQNSLHLPETC